MSLVQKIAMSNTNSCNCSCVQKIVLVGEQNSLHDVRAQYIVGLINNNHPSIIIIAIIIIIDVCVELALASMADGQKLCSLGARGEADSKSLVV